MDFVLSGAKRLMRSRGEASFGDFAATGDCLGFRLGETDFGFDVLASFVSGL
jgi:hypothetical protein